MKEVTASAYVKVVVEYDIELDESELADLLGCEIEDLPSQDEKAVRDAVEQYGMDKYEDHKYSSSVYSSTVKSVDIEEEELDEEEEETN